MPHARTRVGDAAATILGRALLWYVFSDHGQADVPPALFARINNAYQQLGNNLENNMNPVKKIPIVVSGHEGEVYMDEIPDEIIHNPEAGLNQNQGGGNLVGGGNNLGGAFIDRPIRQQLLAIHSQLLGLRRSDETHAQALLDLRNLQTH